MKEYKRSMTTILTALLFAAVVVLMRVDWIPSVFRVESPALVFLTSDFFVLVGAGLCGWRGGLLIFEVIFWAEYFSRQGDATGMFTLFIYLALALLSGVLAEKGCYRTRRGAAAAFLTLEIVFALLLYSIYGIMGRSDFLGTVIRSASMELTPAQAFLGILPETALAVLCLRLYDRFAPERIKRGLGSGRRDAEAGDPGQKRLGSSLEAKTTLLLLLETMALSFVASGFSRDLFIGYVALDMRDRLILIVQLMFLMMSVSLPLALLLNEILARIVVRPINRMERYMRRYFADDGRAPREKAEEAERLGIRSRDEIGRLYESMKKMLREMADHIATQEKKAQLEAELQVAEAKSEAKSAFLSGMSHEIRTPINAVLGMDEMILRESREESTLEYAENIRAAGTSLLGLVNDILDFSKIEAGKMDILPVEYETASMLNDLVSLIQKRAEDKGLALNIQADAALPAKLYGDELRVKQVVTNILTNAVKYTEKGGVTLAVRAEPSETAGNIVLCVSVSDTGIGIKPEDMEKLFSAFERIEETRNRHIEGTGLGMNITQRLLAMMGSRLEVESVYGKGSTFSFRLEQGVADAAPMGDFTEAYRRSLAGHRHERGSFTAPEARILAVDDTPMNLTVLQGLLKRTRVRVDTAQSGMECLDLVAKTAYDMIFLDHRMPEMDGVETRRRMEALAGNQNKETPVVALTANAVSGAREEYLALGFTDYLAKPIDASALEKLLLQYLPPEKVKPVSEADGGAEPDTDELPQVEGLDWGFAALHLPERALLETALRAFYDALPSQAEKLDGFYQGAAWEDYRILVHAMKSSAATVGIVPLAGMAKVLEYAARDGDVETLRGLHAPFLREWRSYGEKLKGVFGIGEKSEAARDFDAPAARALLETIKACMDDFDVDGADAAMERLSAFRFPARSQEGFAALKTALLNVDSDAACRLADELLKEV